MRGTKKESRMTYIDELLTKEEKWDNSERSNKILEKNYKYGMAHGRHFETDIFGHIEYDFKYCNGLKKGKQIIGFGKNRTEVEYKIKN